jgi:SWI/SNF-related matrix-associated actin-dependent regulator of chromatin subfamily D
LPYTIRLPSITPPQATIYDIPVLVDDPLDAFMSSLRTSTDPGNPDMITRLKQIAQLDADIALAVQAMNNSKAKITFLNSLSADPVNFVRKWLNSQKADEEVALADEKSQRTDWHKWGPNGVWESDIAKESVSQLLARKPPGAM